MRTLEAVVRIILVILMISCFLVHMSFVRFFVRERWKRVRESNRLLSKYSKVGLRFLNMRVNPIGLENLRDLRGGLFVGNHLTYMDVLALSSNVPSCFVTSTEIKAAPLLGQICTLAGCLFVERRNKHNIRNEISEIREGLQVFLNVTIFPEATSTNGEKILRFRKPLFLAAIDGGRSVIPFCLNYRRVGGEAINIKTRDKIFWYGDMDFAPHLWALASSGGVEVDLHFLPPIPTHLEMDATALAEEAQRAVESVFKPVVNKNEGPNDEPSFEIHGNVNT